MSNEKIETRVREFEKFLRDTETIATPGAIANAIRGIPAEVIERAQFPGTGEDLYRAAVREVAREVFRAIESGYIER